MNLPMFMYECVIVSCTFHLLYAYLSLQLSTGDDSAL